MERPQKNSSNQESRIFTSLRTIVVGAVSLGLGAMSAENMIPTPVKAEVRANVTPTPAPSIEVITLPNGQQITVIRSNPANVNVEVTQGQCTIVTNGESRISNCSLTGNENFNVNSNSNNNDNDSIDDFDNSEDNENFNNNGNHNDNFDNDNGDNN